MRIVPRSREFTGRFGIGLCSFQIPFGLQSRPSLPMRDSVGHRLYSSTLKLLGVLANREGVSSRRFRSASPARQVALSQPMRMVDFLSGKTPSRENIETAAARYLAVERRRASTRDEFNVRTVKQTLANFAIANIKPLIL
jgi:hypothetical protein